jgi:GT2 family glycosyltransferase
LDYTIVIPTFDRPDPLRRCLEAVSRLVPPAGGFEVVVVDDGGSAPLEALVERFRGSLRLTLLHQRHSGPARARNAGAAVARGRCLGFLDDDCRPQADWLTQLHAQLQRTPDRLVGGATVNALGGNVYSTVAEAITSAVYAHYNAARHNARFFASNNMALCTARYHEVGGFNENFVVASEDREFCDRWRHRGYRMTYVPEAVIRHAHPQSLTSFCARHWRLGCGAAQFHRVRRRRGSGRIWTDIGFHADVSNWLLGPLRKVRGGRVPAMAGLLLLWQAVNAGGFLYDSVRQVNSVGLRRY